MTAYVPSRLPSILAECNNEEEVKSEFAKAFKYKLDARARMDLYTPRILFEFKFSKNFKKLEARASTISQLLYYIRAIKFGNLDLKLPAFLCCVDKNEAFFIETISLKSVYDNNVESFDWDRAPSTPCPEIVAAVAKQKSLQNVHVYALEHPEDFENFCRKLNDLRQEQLELDFSIFDKKSITESNFETAFSLWNELFGPYVEDGRKTAEYFLADLQEGKSQILFETGEVAFDMGGNKLIKKPMPIEKYKFFWQTYSKLGTAKAVHAIWQKVDRLSKEDFRRFTGEFYTPVEFAQKAIDYLVKEVGENWWERGYRLWDMAAGTGNLEHNLPEDALPYCYISTLLSEDADYCARLYPQATVFQYDYLNDDVALLHHSGLDLMGLGILPKMPMKLYEELRDPSLKWIIFINPPFATANVGARSGDLNKDAVSMTAVRKLMADEKLLETSRELFTQFLWRISRDFASRTAVLGMFSKIKYLNSNNDQTMRDTFFKYAFRRGFCFSSKAFPGNKGSFPVGFLIWDLGVHKDLREQSIWLDVFNIAVEKIGKKNVPSTDRQDALSKWVPRPPSNHVLPPLSNAITVVTDRVDVRDRVAEGFLLSLMAAGNDFAHQNNTALLSGPQVSAGAISVTAENFEKAMVWHAVRRIPKASWLNDRDQWMQPQGELSQEFVTDCVVWSAFSNSNQTASLTGIKYKGQTFDLQNQLFPFPVEEVKAWSCSLGSLEETLLSARRNRFFADWLLERPISLEAETVLDAGREVFKFFFENAASLPWPQFRIRNWDVGLYQVRQALTAGGLGKDLLSILTQAEQRLGGKLLPELTALGFLQSAEVYFMDESVSV